MKAARFEYHCAATVAEACQALATHEDARLIAGGQTLVPMMAMRLARPSLLVDIARISELRTIEADGGALVTGACVRQAQAERDRVRKLVDLIMGDVGIRIDALGSPEPYLKSALTKPA